jgi:hypothetical protein
VLVPRDLDLSRAVCRVCGEGKLLAADNGDGAQELSIFSERHTHRAAFAIDVVVASDDELTQADDVPRQRERCI